MAIERFFVPKSPKARKVNLFYQNVRGLKGKLGLIKNTLTTFHADIIAVTESRLDDTIHDSELFPPDYVVLRADRRGRGGGGVLLAARSPFNLQLLDCGALPNDEIVCALATKGHLGFILCIVYLAPNIQPSRYYSVFNCIEKIVSDHSHPTIILGDFNLYSTTASIRKDFELLLSHCNLSQQNSIVNSLDRLLDLVLINQTVSNITITEAVAGLVSSERHHLPLDITISCCTMFTNISDRDCLNAYTFDNVSNMPRNFRKANFSLLYHYLANADWSPVYACNAADEASTCFYSILKRIILECVPPKKINTNRKLYPNWFTVEVIYLNNLKNIYHKTYKQTGNQLYYAFFSYYRKLVITKSQECMETYLETLQLNIVRDPSSFWSFVKRNRQSNQPTTFGNLSPQIVADSFADFFNSVYLQTPPALDPMAACTSAATFGVHESTRHVTIAQISEDDVRKAINRLAPKHTQGPDEIPQFVVKDCREIFVQPLHFIFNLSVSTKKFPSLWKTSKVFPIHKSGSKTDIKNYRPIAVLSVFGKIYESIIYSHIYQQLSGWFCDEQHGFLPKRSTSSNLINVTTLIADNLDDRKQVDVTYFDYSKAFDKVDSDILLIKMALAGFSCSLLTLLANYLSGRQQYVQYGHSKSNSYSVLSGIGQGSNLGPLLFLILINDLPACIRHSTCLMYADDVKLALPVTNNHDCAKLQEDISSICAWSKRNKLSLNEKKCSVMSYTRAYQPLRYNYMLENTPLQPASSVRDLGTCFDSQLTFNDHILNTCVAARKCLGFVIRQSKNFNSKIALSILYNAYVRSRLETNAIIWSPHEQQYILILERIQKSFIRFLFSKIYGYYPYLYPTLYVLGMVNYTSLETRRNIYLVKYFFNLIRGQIYNPSLLALIPLRVPPVTRIQLRPRRRLLFAVPAARTHALSYSPLHRGLALLNDILNSDSKLDIFCSTESSFLTLSSRYLESINTPSSIQEV